VSDAPTKKLVDSFGRSLEDRAAEMNLIKEANEEARERWSDPQFRADFAADLTESILLGFESETLVDRWIETERLDFGGRSYITEATGLKAFWMARGGYIEMSELTSETSELPRDMIGAHVWEFDDKFVTNFATQAQTYRNLIVQRLDAEINRRVHTVLAEAIPDTSSPYYVATPGVSKAAVDTGIRAVQDASLTGDVVIVGRPQMVDQIVDFEGYGNETLEEIRVKGVLGTYHGATVVRLKNYKDENNKPYLPGNEMWIMGRDAGKFAFYGGLLNKEFEEADNWYWHYLIRRDCGLMVHHPERVRRIVDTNLAA